MPSATRIPSATEVSSDAGSFNEASNEPTTNGPSHGISTPDPGQQPGSAQLSLNGIAQLNVEGLKTSTSSSVSFVKDTLEEHNLLFIMLTETWLRDHVDAELTIPNYVLHRQDRSRLKKRRGRNSGGGAVYVRRDIAVETVFNYSSEVIDALCLNFIGLNLLACLVYRQPDDQVGGHRSTAEEFSTFVDKLNEEIASLPTPTPNIILGGDFNLPHASWPSGESTQGAPPDERRMLQVLSNFSTQHFLVQITDQPTHRAGNILDLLFTNCPENFISVQSTPTEPISSHNLVRYTTLISSETGPIERHCRSNPFDEVNLFSEDTNWQVIRTALREINWQQVLQPLNPTEILDILVSTCGSLAQMHAPKKVRKKPKSSQIPRHRRILMRKRTRIRKQYHAQAVPTKKRKIQSKLANIERRLQESYRSQEKHDEEKAINKIKSNSKYFFSYARRKAKIHTPIGPLTDSTGNLDSSPAGMAKILSQQYESAFSTPSNRTMVTSNILTNSLDDILITEESIIKAIDEVTNNSAPGPDGFPAVMLKSCKQELAKPLCILWRKSLDTAEVPADSKISYITPIHKGGSRHIAKNYRPVALTSHLVKIFEKVIRNSLVNFIETHNLMNPNQHGFRAGHSCLSQLLQHQDRITQLLEEGCNVDVVYLDFSKAFDKLDINITLQKLYNMGITGSLFRWIKAFLSDRRQCVLVDGVKSEMVSVRSGVPQGSVIGPLLFLILLNDIDVETSFAHVSSFADDTRVFSGIRSIHDVTYLQRDLDTIFEWAEANNATFNSEKFECLRYGPDETLKQNTSYLSSNRTPIQCSQHVRDLGVTVSHDATFIEQINNTIAAANIKCGWILRTFKTRDKLPLITLWKSLVAPVLDYCCQLWSPSTPGLIQRLEGVQSSFFRKIVGMAALDYWEQLKALKMSSLQRRRERYICIYVWKVLEGLVPNFGLQSNHNIRRGRSCIMPAIVRAGFQRYQTIRSNSMGIMGSRLFNHLPSTIRDMSGCSVDTFKRRLDEHLDAIPDEPRLPRLVRYCSKGSNSILEYNSRSIAPPSRLAAHTGGQHTAALSRLADHTGGQHIAAPSRLADHTGGQPTAAPSSLADHTGGQLTAAPSRLADHTDGQPTAAPNSLADHTGGQPSAAPSRLAEDTGGQPTAAPSLADNTGGQHTAASGCHIT